ncbi:MAG: phenylacetic acid degradation operon negative regulatory protein, partial [Parcubacteria group bacterium Gr01-1014_70]
IKKTKRDRVPYQRIVLETIALAGMISMAILAPNALQAFSLFGYGKKKYVREDYQAVRSTIYRLQKDGIVAAEDYDGEMIVSLTRAGERKLAQYRARALKDGFVPERWDGKWRIVIFDIVENRRRRRDWLRRELRHIGFVRLQNSVWITPYPCEEYISLLKVDGGLGASTLFIVADSVENEQRLKKQFQLA